MKRDIAIFAGTSNTMGLGLELEFGERFQSDEYLSKCKNIPPIDYDGSNDYDTYTTDDIKIHRKYRWPKLVCDHLKLKELNINDPIDENSIGFLNKSRQAVDTIFNLYDNRNNKHIKEILNQTKYIFLEFGYIRWWEEELHENDKDINWPSTPSEIDRFLKDDNVDFKYKQKAIDWLNELNPIELWNRTLSKIKKIKTEFSDIEFVLLSWGINPNVFELDSTLTLIDTFVEMQEVKSNNYLKYDVGNFLAENKLQIKDTVLAYHEKYKNKWLYIDHHANAEGHKLVSNKIIKKLES